ncbi:MAG TPA: Holliday junction branch migration protein RuvA [Lachnospiraceae bacterium]|nr:Holliday junction branch migration protein RuvA [Lachnospiraceae bacterium]
MISFVKGIISEINSESVVVETTAGVGYELVCSTNTLKRLPDPGTEVKLLSYLYVREDIMMLYGFMDKRERETFGYLIGVSGIGPKGAIAILSELTVDELYMAILSQDAKAISRANGIGSKTAQRVLIDLKDKIDLGDMGAGDDYSEGTKQDESVTTEAAMALTALGYSNMDALRAIKKVEGKDSMTVEELIKAALKKI